MSELPFELLSKHFPPGDASILWVGDRLDARLTEALGTASQVVQKTRIPGAFDYPEEFDVLVVADGFERDPWPRWVLQRAHRCLRPGGTVMLNSRRPRALGTVVDWIAAARRAVFSARRFLHKRMSPGQAFPEVAPDTRLSDDELMSILASLHFKILESPNDARAPVRRIVARALPSLYETGTESPFPDPTTHRATHEQALADDFARRDAWAAASPRWAPGHPAVLEPSRWSGRNLLVLSPHPDDEIIGCGGTLLRAIDAGARVLCIQATDGSAGAALAHEPERVRVQRRLDEALDVARRARFDEVILWREDNRHFAPGPERTHELRVLLREHDVATVFVPFVTDRHPDHQTLVRLLAAAIDSAPGDFGSLEVAQYEVWSCAWPTHMVDITAEAKRLEDLLCCYDTAMKIDDYVHLCERRGYYNAITHGGFTGYAEVLNVVPAREYPELVRSGLAQ